MSNIHGLFSNTNNNKKKKNSRDDHDDDDEEDEEDDHEDSSNHRYVGGISQQGGGSGLAVQPNRNERTTADDIFRLAERDSNAEDPMGPSSSSSQPSSQRRATITMYRNGFIVDDGPYRRLDDPANADFLKSLAEGRAPRELMAASGGSGGSGDAVVGLVDKRHEDYEEPFRSFSGTGHALTASTSSSAEAAGIYHRAELLSSSPGTTSTTTTMTSIAVRLPNGKRHVLKISSGATIRDMMIQLCHEVTDLPASFRIISGYPPKPLMDDDTTTITDAGLQGAQISIQNV